MNGRGCVQQVACMAGGVHGKGGMHGQGGICGGGMHVWQGGMCGKGACMAGSMHGRRACMPHPPPRQILRDTVNERAVRILLEYILVNLFITF